MKSPNRQDATLIEVLRHRAADTPDRPAYCFLADGEVEAERLTWAELEARVRTVAAALSAEVARGERALLLYPPGLEFVAAFLGCLAAGVIAVPAYPPRPRRDQPRLRSILADATPRIALTSAELAAGLLEMDGIARLATDTLPAAPGWEGPLPEPESPAFLQYTSGSTSLPKGVTVTHANLVHNSGMIQRAFRQDAESVVVGWLPLYHDMGLIGNVLQPLCCGGRCVLMSPVAFLQRPRRWLEAIGRYRATTSGGPNFAYELCAQKIGPAEREGLDLSSWRVAFNGAEPVRAEALERFAAAFGPQGFRREAFYPCYGLAEATLFVSGATLGEPVRVEAVDAAALERHEAVPVGEGTARRLVSCGRTWDGQRLAVVDPERGAELPQGRVGEVWLSGPSVARGYWGRPEVTERDFQARLDSGEGPFLRTGDLGFVAEGELYVTGRLKDLIILRGRNHYPQDLERTAEASHPELRSGGAAAFAVEVDGEERLVVAVEVERRRRAALEELAAAVRRAVAEEHEVQVYDVVLLKPGGLPKTSSGKVQRHACRAGYLAGTLEALATSAVGRNAAVPARRPAPSREELAALPEPERREAVLAWLGDRVANLAGLGRRPAPDQPLTELGLDSLSAVELKGEVEAAFGGTVPLGELLGGWGIGEVAEWALVHIHLDVGEGLAPSREGASPSPTENIMEYPLSIGQEALWFLERLAPTGGAYNIAVAARAEGELDGEALRRALLRLVARHPALRTTFQAGEDGAPVQRVGAPAVDFAVAESETRWMEEAWRPFDLENGPLLRVRLLSGSLLFAVHHLVADFWSLAVASRELGALYREETGGAPADLPSLEGDYSGFVRWQRERLAGPRGEELWGFWREALSGPPPDLDLPTDLPRPPVPSFQGGARALVLPSELAERARSLARQSGATLFTTLLAVWQTLLGRWTGQEDFAVGSPTVGRPDPAFAGLVGYFVNPVPLRANLAGDPPFADHLGRTRATALAALEHADYPLPLLVERLQPSRDPSRSPLFQTMLILQAVRPGEDPGLAAFSLGEAGARVDLGGLTLESLRLRERRSQFDLTLRLAPMADPADRGLGAVLEYAADLFEVDTAGRMLGHFRNLLAGAAADPARRLWDLPLLSDDERHQLLVTWNEAGRATPRRDVCLHELFAEQVQRTPDAEALVDGRTRLTYRELAARSRRWAEALRDLGVGPEVRVGVCLPRTADLVAVLLGVLEAGGAYVPLDPAYPRERIAFMLEDSGAQVLITSREVAPEGIRANLGLQRAVVPPPLGGWVVGSGGGEGGGQLLFLRGPEVGSPPPVQKQPPTSVPPHSLPPTRPGGEEAPAPTARVKLARRGPGGDNLAYLIYTSGSTGRPKGVAIEHRSAAALVEWSRGVFSPEDLAGVLASTSVCFDLSIFEIFVPLSHGGRVILAENALALPKLPAAAEVTLVNTVPSAMAELVRSGKVPRSVRVINLAGEPIPPALAAAIHDLEGPRLQDLYGPSEDTTYSTGALLVPGGDVTIGRPIAGTRAYLLDHHGGLLPAGGPGELYLGGAGLARGYLGRPDLTAERFVPDPFGEEPGGRLYRTGDLVRLRRDGDLDFLGRIDHQVKVRGYRIELGEVEAAIAREPEVRGVSVLALEDGAAADRGRRLVAFVATDRTDLAAVRDALRRTLPEPMVPTRWLALPELPLTPNGKVDRRALARMERLEVRPDPLQPGGDAPRTRTEETLAALWSEVLGIPRVGRDDNFFDLGGHSLLATRLTARLRAAFGVEPPLSTIFQNPTVARLAAFLERLGGAASAPVTPEPPPLRPLPREGGLPLSFAQERLWFLDRLVPGSAAYNIPAGIRLSGPLRTAALEHALEEIVRRHEALRTVFTESAGRPLQLILPAAPPALPVIDLTETGLEAGRLARWEASRPFDVRHGPLLRAVLLRLAPEEHVLVLVLHHIVADGWSAGVLLDELAELYAALTEGRPSLLPELPVQYADYAVWQREWMRGEVLASLLAFWRARLEGVPVLELPADHPRPVVPGFRGATRRITLSAGLEAGLRALGQSQEGTLFMTLLAAFAVLLGRSAGEDRLAVGSPVANRQRAEIERLVGLFVNSLVLPLDLTGDPVFPDLLARVRETCLAVYAHQELPFERLVEELRPEREPGRNPLFQVLFALEEPLAERAAAGVRLRPVAIDNGTAKLDLTFTLTPLAEGGLAAEACYDAGLFDAATLERLLEHFRTLVEGLAAEPTARLSALPLLGAAERQQLLWEWNDTATEGTAAAELPIHRQIAALAARISGRTAVVLGGRAMTYGELVDKAGHVARHLLEAGVEPEEVVGLCLDRSPEMVAALLGVLAAGAAYLPLEPVHPPERLAWMAADAGVRWIVTREPRAELARAIAEAQGEGSARLLDFDEIGRDGEAPRVEVRPEALAYVLYTSGSTGTPKGVMVPHRALAGYLAWAAEAYGMADGLGAPVHSPLGFDLTVTSLFLPLLAGGTVTLLPEGQGVEALRDALQAEHRFGLLKLTPSHLAYLGETLGGADLSGRAGVLVVGGEALLGEVVTAWRSRETGPGPRARVINEYGPTETAVGCSVYELPPDGVAHGALPIGRPIANARVHLLGPDLRPAPLGAPGEIAIGGGGLARGYRGRPDLTAERFVPDPFAPFGRTGERLYRSGDLARRLPDGELIFLGRRDRQVKIRGFRIELAEVEAALASHPGVTEAVAVVFRGGDGGLRLAAYGVPREGTELPAGLPGFLARRLPGHMLPTVLKALPALPLTANGKVDLEALPRPEAAGHPDGGYAAPRTPTEELLAVLWEEVLANEGLPVGRVGIRDSFFALGGHSLLAARLIARVRETLEIELPLASVFREPTVAGMARRLDEARDVAGVPAEPIAQQPRDRPLPLSFAQERLWFLERLDPGTPLYHIAVALRAEGELRPAALAAALSGVVRRHEALRTAFPVAQGVPVQSVAPPGGPLSWVALPEVDLSALPAARREGEAEARLRELARRPFDLTRGPLLATWLLRLGHGESVVLLVVHHIVSDGWSMGVLIREVKALYGADPELPPLPVQYADYAAWQRERLRGEGLAAELAWWRARLAGAPPDLDLPLDRPRPATPARAGATRLFHLPADAVQALGRRASATRFMTVLAAFQVLLSRLSGQRDLTVGVPVAGRLRPETEDLIGLFVNTLALRAELPPELPFLEALGSARAAVIEAHAHQEVPFERLVEELQPERDLGRTPLFQVMLAPRGTPAVGLDLPGVRLRPAAVETGTAKLDLTLFLSEGDGLGDAFEHSTELFDGTTIQRWAGHLATLLEAAAAEPELRLGDLPLLAPAERHQLLVEWEEAEGVVLDPRGHLAPLGVVGELCLAGEPRRRTGNLARTLSDGRLEHLGSIAAWEEARRRPAPARETTEAEEPRTPTEREVAAIWREVLGIEQALLGRSFFDLGGHSLLAARALARVEEHFGVELPLRELYGAPTIETLAEKIEVALLARADDARLDELLDALEGVADPALLDQLLASEE